MQDDIASQERALARKEAELGPNHRDVADCLSNIAIIYNQEHQTEKAQPLYERALAIFEVRFDVLPNMACKCMAECIRRRRHSRCLNTRQQSSRCVSTHWL